MSPSVAESVVTVPVFGLTCLIPEVATANTSCCPVTRNPEAAPPVVTVLPSTSFTTPSTSTARIVLVPEALATPMETMSVIAEPKSVLEYFVSPERLPPRRRRAMLSSARQFTAHGAE